MNKLKQELLKITPDMVEIGDPILDDRIEKVEEILGYEFPPVFKSTFKEMNEFSLHGTEVYGFGPMEGKYTLNHLYNAEHFEVGNPMPAHVFPFSPDGGGNHYCIDLSSENPDQVLFWVHDLELTDEDQLGVDHANIQEWFQEVIDDFLEYYDYEGNEIGND